MIGCIADVNLSLTGSRHLAQKGKVELKSATWLKQFYQRLA
jgi:hypothetical protein